MYIFKFADQDSELEQIHRLNYSAFVEEIPQHAPNAERRLVDQFHDENCYAIALVGNEAAGNEATGNEVVAMLALRSNRPFSLDRKLEDLDSYLPPHSSLCEIRLLYVKPEHRNGRVMKGMMEKIAEYAVKHGHDMGLISGTTRQQRFYKHLGFIAFGPLVGSQDVLFQPMYLTTNAAQRQSPWVQALQQSDEMQSLHKADENEIVLPTYDPPVNYLPGPVNIPQVVMEVMVKPLVSHRNTKFMQDVQELQARLCKRVNAKFMEFLFGSSTLANEAVAAQLSLLKSRGLILVNGEFGQRVREIAQRWRLPFDTLEIEWGKVFSGSEINALLASNPSIQWIWAVHCETSTGVMNDLPVLIAIAQAHGVKVCVDCISSIGAVEVDLSQVYFATGTSGKDLGAVTGLALVFYNHMVAPAPNELPIYLDLGYYRRVRGVPFTLNSNLVYALAKALDHFDVQSVGKLSKDGIALRQALRKAGMQLLAPDEAASPAVTTIVLPSGVSSREVGDKLAAHGFLLSYESRYLLERNWIQICFMGEYRTDALPDLLRALAHYAINQEQVIA